MGSGSSSSSMSNIPSFLVGGGTGVAFVPDLGGSGFFISFSSSESSNSPVAANYSVPLPLTSDEPNRPPISRFFEKRRYVISSSPKPDEKVSA